jgi:cell wall-associated NlpC family hydrolase
LVPGSEIYLNDDNETKLVNKYFDFAGKSVLKKKNEFIHPEEIIHHAFQYLNTPYLWGGKSILGIDCSGFTQTIFKVNNFELPRDAYQQAELGQLVEFGNQRNADIAFFKNDNNKITHVGICLNNNEIIHCSGFVRVDKLTADGIISKDENMQTHNLAFMKRIGN